jgi:hypothetical protein
VIMVSGPWLRENLERMAFHFHKMTELARQAFARVVPRKRTFPFSLEGNALCE